MPILQPLGRLGRLPCFQNRSLGRFPRRVARARGKTGRNRGVFGGQAGDAGGGDGEVEGGFGKVREPVEGSGEQGSFGEGRGEEKEREREEGVEETGRSDAACGVGECF